MKFNDELTGLIGLAIGTAVIGLVAERKKISRDNIVLEIERQSRNRTSSAGDEVFLKAADLLRKGI